VRLKGVAGVSARTDPEGRATLRFEGRQAPYAQVIAAGRPGYRNAETVLLAGDDEDAEAEIALAALDLTDHAAYPWNEPAPSTDPDDLMACGTCHEWTYAEWFTSRHARAADNGHVTWERERMRKGDPEAPDDCTGCHQPAYAVQDPGGPWSPRGVSAGNHCDFCHKIQDVLDVMESGALGAYHVVRPDPQGKDRPGGIHHVFGPLADSTFAYMGASYAPVYQESRFCAGCHQGGGRWRTGSPPKVNTYEEWRAWVADKEGEEAKQCQDCHMPGASTVAKSGAVIDQVAWDGLHRSADDVHTHRWDATNPQFASRGFELHADKQRDEKTGEWIVTVSMTNSGAGHSIPTGTWSKQVVVGIWAAGAAGPLKQLAGPRAMTDVRAKPGAALEAGDWTNPAGFVLGVSVVGEGSGRPTPPFWHAWPAAQIDDQRLAPGTTREVTCRFEATPDGTAPVVEVRVIHRRAWLPRGAAGVPWTVRTYDAPPEVLWRRLIR
jgi:Zn-finger protein